MASDLISREALLKELEDWYDRVGDDSLQDKLVQSIISFAMDDVNDAEAVDAVPVVRCKDCVSCEPIPHTNNSLWCDEWATCTDCDGFCHKGVKKDAVD